MRRFRGRWGGRLWPIRTTSCLILVRSHFYSTSAPIRSTNSHAAAFCRRLKKGGSGVFASAISPPSNVIYGELVRRRERPITRQSDGRNHILTPTTLPEASTDG